MWNSLANLDLNKLVNELQGSKTAPFGAIFSIRQQ